ncbi:MAG: MarR family transcriptional regulator [Clostridia bacterium]|nr:MarR family transcriptional regulator [Clostridia bacterium]
MGKYDSLKLENQLCFPLYAAAREIVKKYSPLLKDLDLTYTQYIVMMVLWEEESATVTKLGNRLFLDSGTLTPLIRILEKKGYVRKQRDKTDERIVTVSITEKGAALRDEALKIPAEMSSCVTLEPDEAAFLYKVLHKILGDSAEK